MARIVFVLSAAAELRLRDESILATGFWAQEFVAPYHIFLEHGHECEIATPHSQPAALDETCFDLLFNDHDVGRVANLREQLDAIERWRTPRSLERLALSDHDFLAVFFPGGHGPMADLAHSTAAGNLVKRVYARGGLIGAVCHGPAALLPARTDQGWLFTGYRMTCFSPDEERAAGLYDRLKWQLADALIESGAQLRYASAGEAHVISDKRLFTGQNPASAAPLAWHMARELKKLSSRDKASCGTPCA